MNGNTCSSAPVNNNFLLVSDWTHDTIYQMSLENTSNVQAIDIKRIRDPAGVAYDHTRKTVVWGSSADQEIFSVSINGTDEMFLFPTGANRLYWSDGYTDVIESCNLNGSDRRVIFSDDGALLMDIALNNAGNLYYTAWNRPYITKVILSQQFQAVRLFEKPELGRLDALDIYTVDSQPRNPFCSYNNGNCSTFCLPNIYGRTCSCEDGVSILEDGKTCSNIPTTTTTTTTTHRVPIATTTTPSTFSQSKTSSPQSTTTDTTTRRPTETVIGGNNQTLIIVGVGSSAGFLVLLFAVVLFFWCMRKRTLKKLEQERSESINTFDEATVPSRRREERPISSISDIYDNVQDSLYNSDPTYLTAGIDNKGLNFESAWNNPGNDQYSSDPEYLIAQMDNNEDRGESAGIRLQGSRVGRVGQDRSYPDYETLVKTRETAYPQPNVRARDYETSAGRPGNDYIHMTEIPKLPTRRDNNFNRPT